MILCWPRLTIRVTTLCFYILSCEASQPQHSLSDHRTQKRCGLSQEEECPLYIRACVCVYIYIYIYLYEKRINICAYRGEKNHHRRVSLIIIWKPLKGVVQKVSLISQQHQRAEAPRHGFKLWNDLSPGRERLICLNCVSSTFMSPAIEIYKAYKAHDRLLFPPQRRFNSR
jgi:hypothetical protein